MILKPYGILYNEKMKSKLLAVFIVILALYVVGPVLARPLYIDGTHRLNEIGKNLGKPSFKNVSRTRRVAHEIGEKKDFWTFNFASNTWEITPAELKVVGKTHFIYLESGKDFSPERLESLKNEFDNVIYPTTSEYFGHEAKPGIDGDNEITILLMDIKDDFETSGVYTSGYFNLGDCYRPEEIPEGSDLKSNMREMLYADINPSDISSKEFFATIAHELQHLIHFHNDSKEYSWLNEGCSQIATYLCGYGHPRQIEAFKNCPDNSLIAWARWNQVANYGQTYLWNFYLLERFLDTKKSRVEFFHKLVSDQKQGRESYDSLLKDFKTSFEEQFKNFCITNFINRKELSPAKLAYGKELPGFVLPATAYLESLPNMFIDSVSLWGADLVKVNLKSAREKINVSFAGDLKILKNSFYVSLIFLNEGKNKVLKVEEMKNISSTDSPLNNISMVMFPGDNNGGYNPPPPPPVKTQMGQVEIEVPVDADMLYIVIMGRSPEDIQDTQLGWEGKARYRVDVKTTGENRIIPVSQPLTENRLNVLVSNYVSLTDSYLMTLSDENERIKLLESVNAELKSNLTESLRLGSTEENKSALQILTSFSEPQVAPLIKFYDKQKKYIEMNK